MRIALITALAVLLSSCGSSPKSAPSLNRLADSDSPYLRQHATNPVDWYEWGKAAFDKAKDEDKLVIISVGYSACHWCHVMEKETFSDTTVAGMMNEHFVSIKVDREQRPDVDKTYLNAAMLTTGRTGWPLNAVATADGYPIMAASYFSRENWLELLNRVLQLREENPDQLQAMAMRVTDGVAQLGRSPFIPQAPEPDMAVSQDAAKSILRQLDPVFGGLAGRQKFPMPDIFRFLMAYGQLTDHDEALTAVTTTLDAMRKGGIYDHVGGGFARYSTDSIWHVPHFEKMLYDNAQLLALYSEAYRLTDDESYRTVVAETVGWLQRDMTDSLGGLYTSLDADSEGEEGAYYLWTEKEFLKTLGMKARPFKDYFHVVPQGNWDYYEDQNVLFVKEEPAVIAQRHGYTEAEFEFMIPVAKQLLRGKRSKREMPHRDEKILTAWNALMISGYAEAYRSFGDDSLLTAALDIAGFLMSNMKREDGGLYRSWFEGEARIHAFADDYAYLIEALVDLYQVTFDERWLNEAQQLMAYVQSHFADAESPYFFYSEAPLLGSRTKEIDDHVTPGTNASLARGLFLLGTYYFQESYLDQALEMLTNLQPQIRSQGASYAHWARLSLWLAQPPYEVAIIGSDWKEAATGWWQRYDSNVLLLGGAEEGNLPLLERKRVEGKTVIYVCQDRICQLPVEENAAAFEMVE